MTDALWPVMGTRRSLFLCEGSIANQRMESDASRRSFAYRWMHEMKAFGIGLGRTGTLSLTNALEQLGFRTKHCPGFHLDEHGQIRIDWSDFDLHDAVTDEGAALVYQEADLRYPGSKFILTIRDIEGWLHSRGRISEAMRDSWASNPPVAALHQALYGASMFDPPLYAEAHRWHIAAVQAYFADRPGDLLVMNICGGDGWAKLCPFLHRPVPDMPFPKSNVFTEMELATKQEPKGIQPADAIHGASRRR